MPNLLLELVEAEVSYIAKSRLAQVGVVVSLVASVGCAIVEFYLNFRI